jgi:hypothetical protein
MSTLVKPEVITIYCAHRVDDDGRRVAILGYYSTKSAAEHKATSWGKVDEEKGLALADGTIYLLCQEEPIDLDDQRACLEQQIRETALAKLTPEERRVLKV